VKAIVRPYQEQAVVAGKDFRDLTKAIGRFPGWQVPIVNVSVSDGKLTATQMGMATAKVVVPAGGRLPWTGVDARVMDGIAALCTDTSKVILTRDESQISLKCLGREEKTAATEARADVKIPSVKDLTGIEISEEIAPRVAYLAEVAHSDTSRVELCCVMMTATGELIACSPKIIAVMKGQKMSENIAVPLMLAKVLITGDVLYLGPKVTIVKTAIAAYSMAAPVRAQIDFPIGKIVEFGKSKTSDVASMDGGKFVAALEDCKSCLSRLAPVDVIVDLAVSESEVQLSAASGPTVFKASIPLTKHKQMGTFRAPMAELVALLPFMADGVRMAKGEKEDLFLRVDAGWIWFPAYVGHHG
jgi:hypothetical protein